MPFAVWSQCSGRCFVLVSRYILGPSERGTQKSLRTEDDYTASLQLWVWCSLVTSLKAERYHEVAVEKPDSNSLNIGVGLSWE